MEKVSLQNILLTHCSISTKNPLKWEIPNLGVGPRPPGGAAGGGRSPPPSGEPLGGALRAPVRILSGTPNKTLILEPEPFGFVLFVSLSFYLVALIETSPCTPSKYPLN
jgi:hypothetical protein